MRILLIALALFTAGCVNTAYDPEQDIRKVVILGYLYANEPVFDVRIMTLLVYGNASDSTLQEQYPVEDAHVLLKYDGQEKLLEHTADGIYQALDLIVQIGKTYEIEVTVRDTVNDRDIIATARTTVPGITQTPTLSDTVFYSNKYVGAFDVPPPPNRPGVVLKIDNPDNSYYVTQVENSEANPELIVEKSNPEFQHSTPFNTDEYKIKVKDDLYYFGKYVVKLYRFNDELSDLWDNISPQMWWLQIPDPSVSNITNGYGFFTALTSSDSVSLEVIKIPDTTSIGI